MTWDTLIDGLKARGFQYTEDICNLGGCHKDERHFILLTDGLVIYSNFWDWKACQYPAKSFSGVDGGLYEIWCMEPFEGDDTKEFTFEELDFIMS